MSFRAYVLSGFRLIGLMSYRALFYSGLCLSGKLSIGLMSYRAFVQSGLCLVGLSSNRAYVYRGFSIGLSSIGLSAIGLLGGSLTHRQSANKRQDPPTTHYPPQQTDSEARTAALPRSPTR